MLRSAASPGSVGFGRFGGGTSGLLMTPLPTGHLRCGRGKPPNSQLNCAKYERRPGRSASGEATSLDLGFAEFDVLLGDRVVFLLHQLVGHGARIFARDVIEAGVGAGNQFHFDGGGLRHGEPRSRLIARFLSSGRSMAMLWPRLKSRR